LSACASPPTSCRPTTGQRSGTSPSVVGAGKSRRLIRSAVGYADEVNVYAEDEIVRFARDEIERSARDVALSVYAWAWPDDVEAGVRTWADCGVDRAFLTFWPPYDEIETAAALAG